MRVAIAIPPCTPAAAGGALETPEGRCHRFLETVRALAATGHEPTLLVPAESASLTLHVRRVLSGNGYERVRLKLFELPSESDEDDLGQARSLIWTKFLQDVASELVIVVQDPYTGRLRCTEPLEAKVLTWVELAAHAGSGTGEYRGVRAHIHAQAAAGTGALLGADQLAELVARADRMLGPARQPDARPYLRMVAALGKLARPARERLGWAVAIAFNEAAARPRHLLLDVSVIVHGDARSGIQRVVRSLFTELLLGPPQGMEVRLIHFIGGAYRYANVFTRTRKPTPHIEAEDTLVDFRQDDVYLALDLNTHLVDTASPAFAGMQSRGVSLNFVVYDILLVHHPEWWKPGTADEFRKWLVATATLADRLVCISDAVATDVSNWASGQTLERVGKPATRSFHLGADVASSAPSAGMPADAQESLAALSLRPSFLMVGTVEPRKGHSQALAAFELLWSAGVECNLVIVGRAGWLVDELSARLSSHPESGKRLFWFEGISDEYLEKIYQGSACLLAPSLGEGFGLPLIEGAQHGLPIIARNLPVFREVAGSHAHYFDGDSPQTLASSISTWLELSAGGHAPSSRGMPILTWKQSAGQVLAALGLPPAALTAPEI